MYLGGATYTSKILEDPEVMDLVENPYVIVIEIPRFQLLGQWLYKDMTSVITLMHAKSWETVNISFNSQNQIVALLKNPRAKQKNQPETQG